MKHSETRTRAQPSVPAATAACFSVFLCLVACGVARADTIFLKDGTQILDCKVTGETETRVSVRTPSGDMVVPRSAIHRMVKQRTVHDEFAERLARTHPRDINGLFKLATWARNVDGLRSESNELLAGIIASKKNHTGARRMLGHIRVRGEWMVPPPLSVRLVVEQATGVTPGDLRAKVAHFLESRPDVQVTGGGDETPDSAGAGESLDACTLSITATASRKAAGTFYGMKIGRPSFAASVNLEARSPWVGRTALKTSVTGMVPVGSGGTMALGVQNALGSNSTTLHRFLDRLIALRATKLERELNTRKK